MAVWQFSLDFYPRRKLLEIYGSVPDLLSEEDIWTLNLEEGVEVPQDLGNILKAFGPSNSLWWRPDALNFGDYDKGSNVTVFHPNSGKTWVFARLHANECADEHLRDVANLAVKCDCMLLGEGENLFAPELDLIAAALKASRAYRFCKDPKGYLTSDEVAKINMSVNRRLSDAKFDPNR